LENFSHERFGTTIGAGGGVGARVFEAGGAGFCDVSQREAPQEGDTKTPGVCGGEACVGETRLAVWMLVEARCAGCTDEEILQDYPGLNAASLANAWAYAANHAEEIEKAIAENSRD